MKKTFRASISTEFKTLFEKDFDSVELAEDWYLKVKQDMMDEFLILEVNFIKYK